jgi:hypothetical protein
MNISKEDPRFWDVRTIDRRVRKGLINRKDHEKHLKSLPDVADKAQPIDLTAVEEEMADEEPAAPTEGDSA